MSWLSGVVHVTVDFGGDTGRGSGTVVGEDLVLTAHHVVCPSKNEVSTGTPVDPERIKVRFAPNQEETVTRIRAQSAADDWVLLECGVPAGTRVWPVKPHPWDQRQLPWLALGFPRYAQNHAQVPQDQGLSGTITACVGNHPNANVWQLYCQEAMGLNVARLAGRHFQIQGVSGASIMLQGAVIGIVKSHPTGFAGGIVTATDVVAIPTEHLPRWDPTSRAVDLRARWRAVPPPSSLNDWPRYSGAINQIDASGDPALGGEIAGERELLYLALLEHEFHNIQNGPLAQQKTRFNLLKESAKVGQSERHAKLIFLIDRELSPLIVRVLQRVTGTKSVALLVAILAVLSVFSLAGWLHWPPGPHSHPESPDAGIEPDSALVDAAFGTTTDAGNDASDPVVAWLVAHYGQHGCRTGAGTLLSVRLETNSCADADNAFTRTLPDERVQRSGLFDCSVRGDILHARVLSDDSRLRISPVGQRLQLRLGHGDGEACTSD